MKKLKSLLLAIAAMLILSMPAAAQVKWGLQAGIVATELKFDKSVFDASNRVGFTGGLTLQVDLPLSFGIQGSLMYVHRTSSYDDTNSNSSNTFKADYLTLPIHLKWNVGITGLSQFFRPFIYTGPSFSYLLSKGDILGENIKKGDVEWDFGFGAEIVRHLQLSIGYGVGCNKIFKTDETGIRTNSWTITLGYLF